MKYNYWVILLLFALTSCLSKENPQPGPDNPDPEPTPPVTLKLSSSFGKQTKTTLGALKDGVFPVYWTDGDRICVNGVKSSTLYNIEPETTTASFIVQGPVAPYHIIYPSIICDEMTTDGIASLTLSAAQVYTPDSFAPMSAILYGSTEGTEGELQNACGVVRIPLVKGSTWGGNIKTITLSSSSPEAPIAGEFTLDTKNGVFEAKAGSSSVLLALPVEGVNLNENDPEYFHIAIPGGDYPDGFSIVLGSDEGNMLCDWIEETAVPNGIVVTLPQIAFKPKDTKYINSIDSWNEFAAAVNSGDYERWVDPDTGEAIIVGDISYGGDLTMIDALPSGFVLNGGGQVIMRANASEPLILLINEGATVKNLTLAGTRTALSPTSTNDKGTGNLAAYNRGTIENCVNNMAITISSLDANFKIGGLVTDNAGLIKDCKNTADITLNFNISSNRIIYGGAIAAVAHRNLGSTLYSGDFINCENKGSIVIRRTATGIFSMTKFALGGIVGCVEQGTKDGEHTTIEGCTNSGNIIYYQDANHTNANYGYSIGGILGRNCEINPGPDFYYYVGGATATSFGGNYVEIKNCTNTGTIDGSIYTGGCGTTISGARLFYHGGLVGCLQSAWDNPAYISGCTVKCDLRAGNSISCNSTGGLFGGLGYANVENCTADVSISLSKNDIVPATAMGYGGGIAGIVLRDATIKDCEAKISYDATGALSSSGAGFVGTVIKNNNLKEHVANLGMATLSLEGTNYFSGTIKGVLVTQSDIAVTGTAGVINGTITIK